MPILPDLDATVVGKSTETPDDGKGNDKDGKDPEAKPPTKNHNKGKGKDGKGDTLPPGKRARNGDSPGQGDTTLETPRTIIEATVRTKKRWEQQVALARSLQLAVEKDPTWAWCQEANLQPLKDRRSTLCLEPKSGVGVGVGVFCCCCWVVGVSAVDTTRGALVFQFLGWGCGWSHRGRDNMDPCFPL